MLKRITFTGIDDTTDLARVVELSHEFQLIEWGVLFPFKGRGRWPSYETVERLVGRATLARGRVNLAAHICEPYVGPLLMRTVHPSELIGGAFQRVQINTHGQEYPRADGWQGPLLLNGREYILQLDNVTAPRLVEDLLEDGEQRHFAGLHDLSHGAGVLPSSWPAPHERLGWTGYAGGLGPQNLAEQLPLIDAAARGADYWIDMETHVRTDGRFDLEKVERCLEIAAEVLGEKEPA